MRSDLTCPIEVEGVKVENSDGEILCVIDFLNLLDKTVDSVQMNIVCYDAQDHRMGGRLVRAVIYGGEPHARFTGAFLPDRVEGTVRVEATVEKVWFKDGIVWRRDERNVREYTPNILPEGRELDRLRSVAGPDAMGYAREEDVLWLCVCGRANPIDAQTCFKCGRDHQQVVHAYTFSAIDNTIGRRERDLEWQTRDTLRRSSEQSAEQMEAQLKKRRVRRIALTTVIALLAVSALALAAMRWGVPFAAVKIGEYELRADRADSAKALFDFVNRHWNDAYGARELAVQAETQCIQSLIDTHTSDSLAEAADRALQLGTPQGDALYAQAVLTQAVEAESQGDAEGALALYNLLPDDEQASQSRNRLLYSLAEEAQAQGDYPTAIERFTSLGSYEDAQTKREDCIFQYGQQLMDEGQYAQASEQFLQLTDREDAIDLARQCLYAQAEEEQAAGHLSQAASLYERLGLYQEAETRAQALRYQLGEGAQSSGDIENAAECFALAEGYQDAKERFEALAYALGVQAADAGDFEKAITWLERIDRTSQDIGQDAVDALNRAIYALARQQEDAGQLEEASTNYASLGDYEDAATRTQEIEYTLAVGEMHDAPEAALSRFLSLGDYKDASAQATQCRYQIAMNEMNAGKYEQAIEDFEALSGYQDSAARLLRCRYLLAGARFESGEFEESAAIYEACGTYLDAEERAQRAHYESAEALALQGDWEGAALRYRALGNYEDAAERARNAEDAWLGGIYADAQMDMELGDYDSVIDALSGLQQKELPERYAGLKTLYAQACSRRSEELIAQNRMFEALPILQQIPDDRTAQGHLNAFVYRIIGRWTDSDGRQYEFRSDGSCNIDGEEAYFSGDGREIMVGSEPNPTQQRYHVESLNDDTLTLEDGESGGRLRLRYQGEPDGQ